MSVRSAGAPCLTASLAIASFVLVALSSMVGPIACKTTSSETPSTARTAESASTSSATSATQAEAPAPSATAFQREDPPPYELFSDDMLAGNYQTELKRAQSIGHTSIVFKLTFADGKVAAFKPTSKRGGRRYRGEVAARRLGLALGIGRYLPQATPYHLPKAKLKAAGGGPLVDEELTDQGLVYGAILPWIPDLTFPAMEREPELSRWKKWLSGEVTPSPTEVGDAAAMSTMVLFDYMTGNFDRFSGGNVGRSKGQLLFIDNDGAFLDPMPKEPQERNGVRLHETKRFSKDFIARLKRFRKMDVVGLLGRDLGNQPLLTPASGEGLVKRMSEVIAYADETIAKLGEDVALPWP
ncbi:MAG: hypothetical protein U0174_04985 [Polyangiaceae bacterium]